MSAVGDAKESALESIRLRNPDGLLLPADVVQEARNPNHVLHSDFLWDDSAAAEQHRLSQARRLIRVFVTTVPNVDKPVRAYVSVPLDRCPNEDGEVGGYRRTEQAIKSKPLVDSMIAEAKRKIISLSKEFAHLDVLRPMWDEIEAVVTQFVQSRAKNKKSK